MNSLNLLQNKNTNKKNRSMTSTYFEQTRLSHADIEQSVKSMVYEFQHKGKTQRASVYQNHRINEHLDRMQQKARTLLELYDAVETGDQKRESFRVKEFAALQSSNLQHTIASFDTRLAEIREYHRRFPSLQVINTRPMDLEEQKQALQRDVIEPRVQFTGEEHYGKYVDLHDLYFTYINLPQFRPQETTSHKHLDYLTYLSTLNHFHKIGREKKDEKYLEYIQSLYNYLISFQQRTQPLHDLKSILQKTEEDFETQWQNGTVPGYEDIAKQQQNGNNNDKQDQQQKQSSNEVQTKKSRKRKRSGKNKKNQVAFFKHVSRLESLIDRLVEQLGDVMEATMIHIEKKQVRTWEEIQNDLEREEIMEEELNKHLEHKQDQPEEDPIQSNPLNLPLGWDGKPIPFWLYKLHGLGQEFTCEICGNYSYWGPRAFERHFQEWRHANGMRCLRIPNTRHFHHITKINDAIELWDKIKNEEKEHSWRSEDMEEYEDKEGNVFNKKTYNDLKREGLL